MNAGPIRPDRVPLSFEQADRFLFLPLIFFILIGSLLVIRVESQSYFESWAAYRLALYFLPFTYVPALWALRQRWRRYRVLAGEAPPRSPRGRNVLGVGYGFVAVTLVPGVLVGLTACAINLWNMLVGEQAPVRLRGVVVATHPSRRSGGSLSIRLIVGIQNLSPRVSQNHSPLLLA